jgi:hypothetical protein
MHNIVLKTLHYNTSLPLAVKIDRQQQQREAVFMDEIIKVKQLSKSYGNLTAVHNLECKGKSCLLFWL